jgi:hypothetical protein
MFGGELLDGENVTSFGQQGFHDVNNTIIVDDSHSPNLSVGYIKSSFDVGNLVFLASLSGAFGKSRINHGLDSPGVDGDAVYSDTRVLGGALMLKYILDSNRYVNFQSEYLYRNVDGEKYIKNGYDEVTRNTLLKKQSGFYSQFVAKLSKRWRAGLRYDLLGANHMKLNAVNLSLPNSMSKVSCMVDFNPTEFSRLRVQYNLDKSRFVETTGGFNKKTIHELILQVNLAIGAHGAHSF